MSNEEQKNKKGLSEAEAKAQAEAKAAEEKAAAEAKEAEEAAKAKEAEEAAKVKEAEEAAAKKAAKEEEAKNKTEEPSGETVSVPKEAWEAMQAQISQLTNAVGEDAIKEANRKTGEKVNPVVTLRVTKDTGSLFVKSDYIRDEESKDPRGNKIVRALRSFVTEDGDEFEYTVKTFLASTKKVKMEKTGEFEEGGLRIVRVVDANGDKHEVESGMLNM